MGCTCTAQQEPSDSFFYEICPNYKELDKYTGEGLKRTRAWQGTITPAELKAKRELFWLTRRTGYSLVWTQLRQAVEADAAAAVDILETAGVWPVDNIEMCKDDCGNVYKVPVFVVNDPVAFSEEESSEVKLVVKSDHGITLCCPKRDATVADLKLLARLPEATLLLNGHAMPNHAQLCEFSLEDYMEITCSSAVLDSQ